MHDPYRGVEVTFTKIEGEKAIVDVAVSRLRPTTGDTLVFGDPGERVLTIHNGTNSTVTLSNPTLRDGHAFEITGGQCEQLAAGQTCSLTIAANNHALENEVMDDLLTLDTTDNLRPTLAVELIRDAAASTAKKHSDVMSPRVLRCPAYAQH